MKREKKNRVILVSIMILLLGALVQSCEKPPVGGTNELKPTLEVSRIPAEGVLPFGGNFTLWWNTTNTRTFTIGGKQYPSSAGSISLKLFKDTIFEVRATNFLLSTKVDLEVKVGDWTTSKIGFITHSPWQMTANRAYRDGILLMDFNLSQYQKDEILTFDISGKLFVHRYGEKIGDDVWSFSEDETSILMGKNPPWVGTIAHLSEKKMVLTKVQPYADGLPCLAEVTYERK